MVVSIKVLATFLVNPGISKRGAWSSAEPSDRIDGLDQAYVADLYGKSLGKFVMDRLRVSTM